MEFPEYIQGLLLVLAGLVTGMINTIAGGGALISLPVLMMAGLPAHIANATNRPGILIGSLLASYQFRQKKVLEESFSAKLILPISLGAIAGSSVSVDLNEEVFRKVIGVIMVVMLGIILLKPSALLREHNPDHRKQNLTLMSFMVYFLVGCYGGFLQAGVGFFMIFSAVYLSGMGLIQANALKVWLTFILTIPSLAVFIYHDLIAWKEAACLALGSLPGSYLGSKMTVSWGPVFARYVLMGVVSLSAFKLLFF